jgi:hypothetical protein
MPRPNLIHPVKITIEIIDRTETLFDTRAKEPVRQVRRKGIAVGTTSITIKGQNSFYFAGAKLDYPSYERGGVNEDSVGYVSFRFKDLVRAGLLILDANKKFQEFKIKRGDKIIWLDKRPVEFFIIGLKDFAHYPNFGQTMIQINYSDRTPSTQGGDL